MLIGQNKQFWVYILASKKHGTLYIGMTEDLPKRIWMHREKLLDGFTKQYGVNRLVWREPHQTREAAFTRERQLKKWKRAWKIELIEKENPDWVDLYETLNH
ncbi:MAG: GIY-YIG nuclease family protein [Pseudomonadota bacterium]